MKLYVGVCCKSRARVKIVLEDGRELPLDPRYDLRTFSAFGFGWGDDRPQALQLALAILADCLGPADAIAGAADFAADHLAPINKPYWHLGDDEVRAWHRERQRTRAAEPSPN